MAKKITKLKKYSAEFKIRAIMDMREHRLSYNETARKYGMIVKSMGGAPNALRTKNSDFFDSKVPKKLGTSEFLMTQPLKLNLYQYPFLYHILPLQLRILLRERWYGLLLP